MRRSTQDKMLFAAVVAAMVFYVLLSLPR